MSSVTVGVKRETTKFGFILYRVLIKNCYVSNENPLIKVK